MIPYLNIAWENIVVGILAAGIVGGFSLLKTKFKEKGLEKKYPIAGEYLTKFEDEIEGESITSTAPATLAQKGKKIEGFTKMSNDIREWIIEGEISAAGHIHGIYYASDPHDKGIGNFFLFINHDRSMEGLWSGYDSVNKKITSGQYHFVPLLKEYTFKNMEEEYFSSVVAISDEQLGKDYLTVDSLEDSINADKNFAKIAVNSKGETIGFYLGSILTPEEIKKAFQFSDSNFPNALNYSKRIGLIRVIAVREDYHNRGIGTALIKDCLKVFSENLVTAMCTVGWRSKKGVNIEGIITNQGFKKYEEFKDYWKEDSIRKGYNCPDCGSPPCTCSAVVFLKFK